MTPSTSFFLDFLRVLAASVVFSEHCIYFWDQRYFSAAARAAHAAVIVFFVLSGYVIAFSTLGKSRGVRAYTVARLSRLYSVLVPALALTATLQLAGHAYNPGYFQLQSRGHEAVRYLVVAASLQSVWTTFASPLANTPFWSLSYECWYYALFGAAVLLPPGRFRAPGVLAVLAISGTDILLLLPCWLAGVACYLGRERSLGGVGPARVGFGLAVLAAGLILALVPDFPHPLGQPPFWFSSMFVSDWLLAGAVGAAVLCFNAARFAVPSRPVEAVVRWGANHTFSLYLYHFPMLAFITAVWGLHQPPWWQYVLAGGGTLLAVLALSTFTEAKRGWWRRVFERVWDGFARPAHS